jgi:hypothetical protein
MLDIIRTSSVVATIDLKTLLCTTRAALADRFLDRDWTSPTSSAKSALRPDRQRECSSTVPRFRSAVDRVLASAPARFPFSPDAPSCRDTVTGASAALLIVGVASRSAEHECGPVHAPLCVRFRLKFLYSHLNASNGRMGLSSCLLLFFANEIEVGADAEGIDQHSDDVP